MDKDVERLGDARNGHIVAFDDGFVSFGTAHDVVGFDGEDFLQDVRGTEGFESPDFHLTETLTAEVGFTAKGLLGDEGVRSNATGMHLVVDHVVQLEHVDVADGGGLVEAFASFAVIEVGATVFGKACFAHVTVNLLECGTVENRGLETFVEFFACPAQHSLVNLAKVHSRRNAEGVQDDVDRCAVGEERHVFGTYNLGHDT